jgi:putative hemolysin
MTLENFWFEAMLILALIFANGFFAAAEIAIIAIRKSRIDALLEKGVRSAAAVGAPKGGPGSLPRHVKSGVTVVSSFASALGGAAAIGYIKPQIADLPFAFAVRWAEVIAPDHRRPADLLFLARARRTGAQIPALRFSEQIACMVARPIESPRSNNRGFCQAPDGVRAISSLNFFGGKDAGGASFISADEVKSLIRKAR